MFLYCFCFHLKKIVLLYLFYFFLFPHDPVNQSEQPPKTIRQTVWQGLNSYPILICFWKIKQHQISHIAIFFLFTFYIFAYFFLVHHPNTYTVYLEINEFSFFFFFKLHEYIFNHSSLTICVRKSHLSVSVTLMLMNKYLHS